MFTSNTLIQKILVGEIESGTYVFWGGDLPPDYDPNTSTNSGELIFNYEAGPDKKGAWSKHEHCGLVDLNVKYNDGMYTVFRLPTGKGTFKKIIYFDKEDKWGNLIEQ